MKADWFEPMPEKPERKVAARNPKARHDYFIEETFEVGIALEGSEVKSLREGKVSLRDSFARIDGEEVFLHHCHISPYSHGDARKPDPLRTRKLLLHRQEINRLMGKTRLRGYALVPLQVYFKKGRAKIELGLAKGKQFGDKREVLRRKVAEREMERALKARR
jgi:SsrA-binding protein